MFILTGLFRLLYNSQPIPKAIFTKILERVYSNPQDKGVSIFCILKCVVF